MSTHIHNNKSRFGFKWNVSECLRLQREFELLRLSVPEIAALHGRTINAIMYKIDLEGFATFNDLYIQTYALEQGDEQVLQLNPADLESESEYSDSDSEEDSEEDSEDDDDVNDEDFIPNVLDESEDDESEEEDDGSNKHYLYSQVKRMQTQITAILGYLSKGATATATKDVSIEAYGGI